jgi:hypothetical protein
LKYFFAKKRKKISFGYWHSIKKDIEVWIYQILKANYFYMTIFEKGNYKPVSTEFRTLGIASLEELSKFQEKFEMYDTDTTINTIRDAIIANYLGFDLLNFDKHGFDAKKSLENQFLEIKQCSVSSKSWGGTWNDTNEEKALAFCDEKLFTAVAIWKGASDLQFIVYGQHKGLGELLYRLVVNRKAGSRSTQSVSVEKLIKDFNFAVICPPEKTKEYVLKILVSYSKSLLEYVRLDDIKTIRDI